MDRSGSAPVKTLVDDAVPADTVDQRVDWAAVSAADLDTGRRFEFNVYDPGTGVSHVMAQVGNVQSTQVPGGRFDTYRIVYQIEKRARPETYQVLVSRDLPRILVREEFPDGTVSELTEIR